MEMNINFKKWFNADLFTEFKECPHYNKWSLKKKLWRHKTIIPNDCNGCNPVVSDKCKVFHKNDSVWVKTEMKKKSKEESKTPVFGQNMPKRRILTTIEKKAENRRKRMEKWNAKRAAESTNLEDWFG